MIAGDLGDEEDFAFRQIFPSLIADEACGPFVMTLAIGSLGPTDVMEQRGTVEEFAWTIPEAMPGTQAVENQESKFADMVGMAGLLIVTGAKGEGFFEQGRHGFSR